jgi:hypothetical protein
MTASGDGLSQNSRRPVQSRPDPRLRLILLHLEHASGLLDFCSDAPPGHECAGERSISQLDREGVISTPRVPEGVIAQPSAVVRDR